MPHLLLLHGALGSAEQLQPLAGALADTFTVHPFNFTGHGGRPLPEDGFSIAAFAEEVVVFLDEQGIARTNIFGYSMGGYVALYLALHYPERVHRIVTLGTKLKWTPEGATQEVKMLDPTAMQERVPKFAEALARRHAPVAWEEVVQETAQLLLSIGIDPPLEPEDFTAIPHLVTICLGEADTMVTRAESERVAEALPHGRFRLLPGVKHPIEQAPVEVVAGILGEALLGERVNGRAGDW